MDSSKRKLVYIEALRIFSAFFVIFNHTGLSGFFLFSKCETGSIQFWLYMFVSIFCKFSVPLFLMISGALMLQKEDESFKELFGKKILKIVIILVFYSVGYYFFEIYSSGEGFDIGDFIKRLYSSNLSGHLWYLYLYIAYLAVLPFLRALVKNLDNRYFYYMIGIAVFYTGILPCIEYLSQAGITLNGNLKISWLINFAVLYPCIGYFLQHRIKENGEVTALPYLWAINVLTIALSCYMTYLKGINEGGFSEGQSQTFFQSFVLVNAITVFITTKGIFGKLKIPYGLTKMISIIGSCCFGIYLWHIFVYSYFCLWDFCSWLKIAGMNSMVAAWVMCFVTMLGSFFITLIMSKVPVLKKLVGF